MSRRLGILLVLLAIGSLSLPSAVAIERRADQPESAGPLSVVLDQTKMEVGPGQRIRFTSTVRNTGDQPLGDLVAHVAILTSDPDVYVDPEDWSPRRTQFIDRLAAGEEASLTWNVQAVTAGPLILYVAVTDRQSDTVAVSGPLYMSVTGRRVVNSNDALPLVAGVPAAVLLLLGITGVRRRLRR
jgi:hypothetical protein